MGDVLKLPVYGVAEPEKSAMLLRELNALTRSHRERCAEYERIMATVHPRGTDAAALAGVPYLPVGLFKSHRLCSVPEGDVFKVLTSGGTTSQQPSRIYLDGRTAEMQTAALAAIMTSLLGPCRIPMLIVDSPAVLKDRKHFSARGAGVLGMMTFGRAPVFALDDAMDLSMERLTSFLQAHGKGPFLIFGFTFMVWEYLYRRVIGRDLDLSQGILVHSGGWKKLQEQAVDNATFKEKLRSATGLTRVYNFYGMVEQVGSVFLEGEDGFLYPPCFADVIIRDPVTWEEAPVGAPGVIEVVSLLPRSYPGHALLTEDRGVVHGIDDSQCGRLGKRLSVLGRIPKAELRGCSDTHAQEALRA